MSEIESYMQKAIQLAKKSAEEDETPVGCIIVKDNNIIAMGRNRRESEQNALCHAEIEAINNACSLLGSWRLPECDLYVTLEPCPMCAGAIINARIRKVYYGAGDPKAGSFGSVINFNSLSYNHKPEIIGGICQEECSQILSSFFSELRKKKKIN